MIIEVLNMQKSIYFSIVGGRITGESIPINVDILLESVLIDVYI